MVLTTFWFAAIDVSANSASKLKNGPSGDGIVLISKKPLSEDGDSNLLTSTRLAVSLGNIHNKGLFYNVIQWLHDDDDDNDGDDDDGDGDT